MNVNTPRTGSFQSHDAPVGLRVQTFDPSCFEGDMCDLAQSAGNVPLDGVSGRPLVVAPMIQDVVEFAKNAGREPIRAADFVMPKVILLTFQDEFSPDPLHPWYGLYTLSPEFYTTLRNNGRPHVLTYLGTAHGASRHWHHTRWYGSSGGAWDQPSTPTSVRRHVWQLLLTYYPDGGATARTMDIRFVMEHTVYPEPLVTPVGGGGKQSRTEACWGAIFNIEVFTDELNPTFADGDSYQPVGASGNVSFTRANPCRWGGVDSLPGGTASDKFCHPQMVICASIPTSFESPFGYDWIPPEERIRFNGFEGTNRECQYAWSNGAPWIGGSCTTDAPAGVGIRGNVVFGYSLGGTHNWAAYTLGGDFPRSKPLEYVVIENGLAEGRTYLTPERAGWDETCGVLDVAGGSSISVRICSDDKYGINGEWPRYEPNSCAGHPDEPFEDVGGSHSCFNNGNPDIQCCIKFEDAYAYATEYCTLILNPYGDFDGGGCVNKPPKCFIQGIMNTNLRCSVYDYDLLMNGDQTLRTLTWMNFKQDPDQDWYDFTYAGTPDADLVDRRGTFTQGATISVSSAGGSGPVRSILFYEPAAEFGHGSLAVRGLQCTTQDHRILFRAHYTASQLTAYSLAVTPSGGSNATLKFSKIISDVETTIATKSITNATAHMDIRAEWFGCRIYIYIDNDTEPVWLLETEDSSIDGTGYCGIGSSANSTSVSFDTLVIDDMSREHVDSYMMIGYDSVTVDIHPRAALSYVSGCGGVNEPGCGTPPRCNCTAAEETLSSHLNATSGPGDVQASNCFTDTDGNCTGSSGTNPGPVNGGIPDCDCCGKYIDGESPCDTCPPPRVAVGCYIPKRCLPAGTTEGKMCQGIKYWRWEPRVVP